MWVTAPPATPPPAMAPPAMAPPRIPTNRGRRVPELRKDPVTGRWVIFAVERSRRPMDFASEDRDLPVENCPFCEGHEAETPHEIYADRREGTAANGPGWRVRVVPNKYPALRVEGELEKTGEGL